jgi:tRNA-specific 2-thiouridylase
MEIYARIRYNGTEAFAELIPLSNARAKVKFKLPQRAVTPGQSVVFYQNDEVLGGGIIEGGL